MVSTSEVEKMDSLPDGLVVKKNARMVSLSGDTNKCSPEAVSSGGAPEGKGPESYRDYVPPRDVDLAGTDGPAVAGMEFPAVDRAFGCGGGTLIRLLLVSRWKILGNPGIGRMVGRVMQTTEMSHLMLGPGDRSSWSRWLGGSLVPDGVG